ncbi:MAG: M48 family metallopeptidase [Ruminococcus sp.]|uniref:M48 family metallopeptidase n=1 Tax=Ruminococcus sp. TaxID=41978 RepID=UPI001B75CA66|nr:SprT family zinc-dependent metalloprotease [Ruminococcus sp.]MBP5578376.1 M48 family metallopeptidase [Ruminococcus sp.]
MAAVKEEHAVLTADGEIEYVLERKKVKNINLRVKPDCSVYVSAPHRAAVREIEGFIKAKSKYIRRAEEYYRSRPQQKAAELQYVSGEVIKLLGTDVELKILNGSRDFSERNGSVLYLHVKDTEDIRRRQKLFNAWLDEVCREIFTDIMRDVHGRFSEYSLPFPQLKLRTMTSRWGSCHPGKKIITLNRRLIEAPRHCIEQVVTHEFCHFVYPDHGKDFYALLQRMYPEWRYSKAVLESTVVL